MQDTGPEEASVLADDCAILRRKDRLLDDPRRGTSREGRKRGPAIGPSYLSRKRRTTEWLYPCPRLELSEILADDMHELERFSVTIPGFAEPGDDPRGI